MDPKAMKTYGIYVLYIAAAIYLLQILSPILYPMWVVSFYVIAPIIFVVINIVCLFFLPVAWPFLLVEGYFFPTLVGIYVGCGAFFKLFLLNLLFGWTGIGWILAGYYALSN
eukprot:GILI01040451.1.p1 GENE.GILI01040451.1~~GILI01040451.1.p1  ORF type:complete len:112 (+),score=11.51 GILI01040451.1:93-428(+)